MFEEREKTGIHTFVLLQQLQLKPYILVWWKALKSFENTMIKVSLKRKDGIY